MQTSVKPIKVDYTAVQQNNPLSHVAGFWDAYAAAQYALNNFDKDSVFYIYKRTEWPDGMWTSSLVYDNVNGITCTHPASVREVCGIKVYEGKS